MNFVDNYSIFFNKIYNESGYDRFMKLKIFIEDLKLREQYVSHVEKHNNKLINDVVYADAGFDILSPNPNKKDNKYYNGITCYGIGWKDVSPVNKIDFGIKCSSEIILMDKFNVTNSVTTKSYKTGYYIYPRSSLSKTKLRLANSTGIIDAGYRGNLIGMFDIVNMDISNESDDRDYDEIVYPYTRLIQVCAPGLVPIYVDIVSSVEELGEKTLRDNGGFGSTGN